MACVGCGGAWGAQRFFTLGDLKGRVAAGEQPPVPINSLTQLSDMQDKHCTDGVHHSPPQVEHELGVEGQLRPQVERVGVVRPVVTKPL
jgi:hypothetical protein